ncbi:MAG: ferrous iron transport protein A [Deltaproteobacteria bacterium]|jgi:ferrous iron transport protein A|nr:ferrous iron transport protein A [Deltaproteobacteria bacterium]
MALPSESLVTEPPRPTLIRDAGVPLSSLPTGSRATITDVDASTPEGHRLLELGFLPDTEICVVRRAPLSDPIAFYLRGGQICLRRSEAARIRVIAIDAEPAA